MKKTLSWIYITLLVVGWFALALSYFDILTILMILGVTVLNTGLFLLGVYLYFKYIFKTK